MDNDKVGYFKEDNGNKSWMRAMCFVALLTAVLCAMVTLLVESASSVNGIYLTIIFVVAAFAPKSVQKFAEQKIGG